MPQAGFWLEMAGAVALALSGAALATLTPDQLATLRPGRLRGPKDGRPAAAAASTTPLPNPGSTPAERNPAGSGGSVDAAGRPRPPRAPQGRRR